MTKIVLTRFYCEAGDMDNAIRMVKYGEGEALQIKGSTESYFPKTIDEFPSLVSQASNLALSGARVIKAIVKKERIKASAQEIARRQAICNECEFFVNKRCLKCGCFIAFKTRLETEHCPIKKW